MAHKKAAGSIKNGRDSVSKRLGVKVFGSEKVIRGEILVRQRGTKFHAGKNVKRVSDDSLISLTDGVLEFLKKKVVAFNGNLQKRTFLNVIPFDTATVEKPKKTSKPAKEVKAKKPLASKPVKKAVVKAKPAAAKKAPKKSETK
jgi:large subunit ribosomal protein L27